MYIGSLLILGVCKKTIYPVGWFGRFLKLDGLGLIKLQNFFFIADRIEFGS